MRRSWYNVRRRWAWQPTLSHYRRVVVGSSE
jgi:hypothetical protein